jgi:hypothetical protein
MATHTLTHRALAGCLLVASCYSPALPASDCSVRCGSASWCPDGLACLSDGFCHLPAQPTLCEQTGRSGFYGNGIGADSTDSLLRVWTSISRRRTQTVDRSNIVTGLKGSGDFVQVGRNALPLFNAGLVGTQRQGLYLHTSPRKDVSNFGNDILFPVLVRDADALGIYAALGVPAPSVTTLKGPRIDIIEAINLGRPIPIADGNTGDVITLDAAIDSSFPNGRRLGGGTEPNRNQVNVNSVLISLIVAGDPAAGLAKGTEVNDKNYLDRFPFLALAHQGLLQGHGGVNVPTVPDIPTP